MQKSIFNRFVIEYADSVRSLDLVSQWQETGTYESALEQALLDRLCPQATRVGYFFLRILNPRAVWLDDLASLRWLVIHPFAMSIRHQLPRLAGLNVYSVRSIAAAEWLPSPDGHHRLLAAHQRACPGEVPESKVGP